MSVKLEGAEELIAKINELSEAENLEKNLKTALALVEASARKKAPKDTGALRRSIESKITANDTELIGEVFTPLEYAPYVEFGTGLFAEKGGRQDKWSYIDDEGEGHKTNGQRPQPFMRPALAENQNQIVKLLKESLNNEEFTHYFSQ